LAALALARAGNDAKAQALADELNSRFPQSSLLQKYWLPTIRASIELSHQNPLKAVALLQSTSYELSNAPSLAGNLYPAYVRGQAYLGTHQGKEAAAEFQKFLDYRGVALNSPLAALARLGLGRSYALQGDRARSASAYKDFLNLWKDADPDIPILKQAKTEYAKLQ
jgi:TolA-binding protein